MSPTFVSFPQIVIDILDGQPPDTTLLLQSACR